MIPMKTQNLDPEYAKATERLNRFFSEEVDDIRELSVGELLWYLSTVLLWKASDSGFIKLINDNYDNILQERDDAKAELKQANKMLRECVEGYSAQEEEIDQLEAEVAQVRLERDSRFTHTHIDYE